ncbi:hypothetical protein EZV62_007430 [Acer yangbiense]|uniref:Protein transport protein Sec61 subunit beta n=1 Tax=Acer yangbiense TaxID=1000413 RepID=A0A5C7IA95_9ROSI|nr:hypothetical protein EZV62_007430 [Acer yangbiense]
MVLNGAAPARGSAAAAASMRRRRTTSGGGGASGGAAGTMLQFYTDDAPGLKISPNVVLVMSIGFIAFVAILHVMGKLYFVRKDLTMMTTTSSLPGGDGDHLKLDDGSNLSARVFVVVLVIVNVTVNSIETKSWRNYV